jgi:hypothetical protein
MPVLMAIRRFSSIARSNHILSTRPKSHPSPISLMIDVH